MYWSDVRRGLLKQGQARPGTAWRGKARHGRARQGWAGQGRQGAARPGAAGQGRQGAAGRGLAGRGRARQGFLHIRSQCLWHNDKGENMQLSIGEISDERENYIGRNVTIVDAQSANG